MNNLPKLVCAASMLVSTLAVRADVPVGNLPLPRKGLVVHLDASDDSTMALDTENRVKEWRSKAGTVKFVQQEGQSDSNLPYFQSSIRIPESAQIPGVVFGFAPDYEYLGTSSDIGHNLRTQLKADAPVVSKEIFAVIVSMNSSTPYESTDINGDAFHGCEGIIYATGCSANDCIKLAGSWKDRHTIYGTYFHDRDGKAWVNGNFLCDRANNIPDNTIGGFEFSINTLNFLDSVGNTAVTHEGIPCLCDPDLYYCPAMIVCEMVVYDYELTADERSYVQKALVDKWQKKAAYISWTGAGDGKTWGDGANWSTGKVPTAADLAVIEEGEVTVTADAICSGIAYGDAKIEISAGTSFSPGAFCGMGNTCVISGTGALKTGREILLIEPGVSIADTVKLDTAIGGVVDLNGSDVICAGVIGGGCVTNSSDKIATLEVKTDAESAIEATVVGNVSIRKTGTGVVRYSTPQTYTGPTVVAGGTLAAVTNLNIDAMEGVQFHLDASRSDTIALDDRGCVTNWCSTTDSAIQFRVLAWYRSEQDREFRMSANAWNALTNSYPAYLATGVNGKMPCVRFSIGADGKPVDSSKVAMGLKSGINGDMESFRHRTMFVVHRPYRVASHSVCPYGRCAIGYDYANTQRPLINGSWDISSYGRSSWGGGTNEVYANARKGFDYSQTGELRSVDWSDEATASSTHVLTVTIPEGVDEDLIATESCVIGCGWFCPYDDGGSYRYQQYAGDICEAVLFDRYLPDAERRAVETHLMEKWNGKSETVVYRPGEKYFESKPSSTVLTIDACNGASLPLLTTIGNVDVSAMTLELKNTGEVERGPILSTDATVTGVFGTITGMEADQKIVYRTKDVILRLIRGLAIMVR